MFSLNRPQQTRSIRIVSWDINSVHTKLEKANVQELLNDFDVICFNEIKTSLPVNFPGYVSYKSKVIGSADRGGTDSGLC